MAQLSNQAFYDKWVPLLADNVFQDIDGARFEQLLADVRDTFASQANVAMQPVAPAVNFDPVLRQLTATHLLGVSELEYNHNNGGFTAYAPVQVDDLDHGQGEWRFRVKAVTGRNASQTTDSQLILAKGSGNPAGPGKIKAVDISDSTEAGRALLTAADVSAQRELLDKFVILAGQYGIGQPRFEHVAGADGLHAYLLRSLASLAASAAPAAPTAGQVDDTGDVFSFLPPTGYSFAQLKVAGLPQTTGAEWLSAANSYVQNGRIYVRVIGAVAKGGLAVYVGASGNVPDGQVLTNEADFTANKVVPAAPGALQVDFSIDNASLSPGDTLEFTAKVAGGTAPYQHSVQALNPDTGTVTILGTASTATYVGTWPGVPAGVYLVTDAVSDSAGASLVSAARRVVVAAPGSGGGAALVPAARTRLGGVRIGDGLEVEPDGLLSTEVQLQKVNVWQEVGDYSAKGLKLPAGAKVDEGGSAFFQRLDIGQRHYTFGLYHSLGRDSMIQWKPDEFINQDGDGDVGLARASQGVLEVNTGRRGRMARLLVSDVEAYDAPFNLSSINLLAPAILDISAAKGAKILWVCGGLTFYNPQRGSLNRPYSSLQQAHDAALAGDLLIVQVGGTGTDALGRAYYREDFLWTKNVRIVFQQGAIHGGLFQLARFNDTDPATLFKRELVGGEFTNRTLVWRHSAGNLEIEVTGAKFTGNGNFEVAGSGSYHNSFLTSARLRNCLFDVHITDSPKGAVRLTGRDDMGPTGVVLENTRIISVRTPTITFQGNSTSFVTLQGALTELVGTPPETLPTVPSGFVIDKADWLHDQRPTTSGGGSGGASTFAQLTGNPRDNAALAGELNAVLALSDGRRNLITTSASRYNDLVLESAVTLSNLRRGPNAAAITGQLLQNGTTAVSAPRQGADADVLAALNADIASLADPSFYIIRFQTAVAVSTDVAHVLLTVSR